LEKDGWYHKLRLRELRESKVHNREEKRRTHTKGSGSHYESAWGFNPGKVL
jgi:hypothetical protein